MVDPRTARISRTFGLGKVPYRVQAASDIAWVANSFDGTLTRVDATSGTVSPSGRPEPSSTGRLALAYGSRSLWVASQDGVLARLDPNSGRLLDRIGGIPDPEALAVGFGSTWVAQASRADVVRVNARTHRIRPIPLGGKASSLATGAGAVWAATPEEGTLWRIDPTTNSVTAAIDVGTDPAAVVVADHYVWVASATGGTIVRVDPRQNKVIQTIHLDGPLGGLAAAGDDVWVSVRPH